MIEKSILSMVSAGVAVGTMFSPLPRWGQGGFWVSIFIVAACIFAIVAIWLIPHGTVETNDV